MSKILFFLLFPLFAFAGTKYTVNAPVGGHLVASGSPYGPGDTIQLRMNGNQFLSIEYTGLVGAFGNRIVVTNYPGENLLIGDSTWNGGSWGEAFRMRGCSHILMTNNTSGSFKIIGSKAINSFTTFPFRGSYYPLKLEDISKDFILDGLTITGGASAVYAKTEVVAGIPLTWKSSGNTLGRLLIQNCFFTDSWNEMCYLGHTAEFWNIVTNAPYYGANDADLTGRSDTTTYKEVLYWDTVLFINNNLDQCGGDAVQFSHITWVECYGNRIKHWAGQAQYGNWYWRPPGNATDLGGILLGGGVLSSRVHDNIVEFSKYGEPLQFYASGSGTHIIQNNLFKADSGTVVSSEPRGGAAHGVPAGAQMQFYYNTATFGNVGIRQNGFLDAVDSPAIVCNNLFIGNLIYLYTENAGTIRECLTPDANKKFATLAAADVDSNLYFLPNVTSTITDEGFRLEYVPPIPPPTGFVKYALNSRVKFKNLNGLLGLKKATVTTMKKVPAKKVKTPAKKPTKPTIKKPSKPKAVKPKAPTKPKALIHKKYAL